MARTVALSLLRSRVKQRANVEVAANSALYTAAELDDNINEGIAELYRIIIKQQDQPHYLNSTTFNTSSSTDTYVIGSGQTINITDFFELKGVDLSYGQNIIATLRPFTWRERNRYKYVPGFTYPLPTFYHLTGKTSAVANSGYDGIKFIPAPQGIFSTTLWYVPTPPVLVNASDTFDGIAGYEEHAVLGAAIKLLTKQERFDHASFLQAQRQAIEMQIQADLSHDAQEPPRTTDVTTNDGWISRPGYY